MEGNQNLTSKKGLLLNMIEYFQRKDSNAFDSHVFPLTFLIKEGVNDTEFNKLIEYQYEYPETIWILKPGENSNRGRGIMLCQTVDELYLEISKHNNKNHEISDNTIIVQKYITQPLLIQKRKFDIRVFGMLTSTFGNMFGYFYEDGYIRTSSKEFNLKNIQNKFVHLTNDAIQKKADNYGKFENGNKLSYQDFQKYLDLCNDEQSFQNVDFIRDILPQIKHLVAESFRSVAKNKVDPHKRINTFEIFGFDFMIDSQFKVYLIEINTNPCLETSCPLLQKIIPQMLESAFRIAVDPLFPPPDMNFKRGQEFLHENKFSLVFDLNQEKDKLQTLFNQNIDNNQ